MYQSYLTYEDYKAMNGTILSATTANVYLPKACRKIDTLTYNRIHKIGFENLTEFQKANIKEAAKIIADFESENEDLLANVLKEYSINGVTMKLDGVNFNAKVINGVLVHSEAYNILEQTGLTCGSFHF